jgi:hypothetical protein
LFPDVRRGNLESEVFADETGDVVLMLKHVACPLLAESDRRNSTQSGRVFADAISRAARPSPSEG